MAVRNPVSGSFSEYANKHLGPLAGFMTGWTYTFEMVIVCLADVTAFGLYMQFWFPDVPRWIWVLAVVFFIGAINLLSVKVFGELEFWFTLVKITAIIAMIAGGIAIIVFGFGVHDTDAGISHLWSDGGFFATGFGGFVACFAIVMFAFGGTEIIGITAGEAEDPAQTIRKAVNTVPVRIILFYICTLAVIMAIIPWQTINSDNSPFVQIFENLGLGTAASILNIVVITAALSAINSDVFGAGRMMFGMSHAGQAPQVMKRVSANGVPWMTVCHHDRCPVGGVLLNYLIPGPGVPRHRLAGDLRHYFRLDHDPALAVPFPRSDECRRNSGTEVSSAAVAVRSDLRDRVPGFCHRVARRHRRYPSCFARRCRMAGSADGRVLQVGETGCQRSGSKWRMTVGV